MRVLEAGRGKAVGRVYNVFGKDEPDGWVEMVTRGVFFSPPRTCSILRFSRDLHDRWSLLVMRNLFCPRRFWLVLFF